MKAHTHTPGLWAQFEIERQAEAEAQLDESCGSCGVRLRDHYTAAGIWLQCGHRQVRAAIAKATASEASNGGAP